MIATPFKTPWDALRYIMSSAPNSSTERMFAMSIITNAFAEAEKAKTEVLTLQNTISLLQREKAELELQFADKKEKKNARQSNDIRPANTVSSS